MKASIYSLIGIAVLPFAIFACSKADAPTDSIPAPLISIEASIPQDASTRVVAAAPESGKGLDWNWAAGDAITVVSGDFSSVFSIRSGFGPKEASFIGRQVTGDTFSIIYPGSYASEADITAAMLGDQVQMGNGSMEHLTYWALLSGVDAYKSFTFSEEWAGEHGGSFKQCGVLRFTLTLPAETAVVNRITLKAGAPVFHKGNAQDALTDEISVGLNEVTLGSDHTVTAWMNTAWFDDVIPAGTQLAVNVAAGDFNWTCDITPDSEKTIKAGCVNKITIGEDQWVSGGRYAEGDGTEENPWQIKTATQLTYVRDDLVPGELRYFKLIADIDLDGIEWAPLNPTDPYDKFISFDGNGHTIYNLTIKEGAAYASFAGVLYGTLKDVTFVGADITAGEGNKCGIVAGYVGTAGALTPCEISGVTVKNSTITGARSMGAFAGQVATAEAVFTNCHVINTKVIQTATSTCHAGGFVGYAQAEATFTDCSSDATVEGTQYTGGFAGYIGKGNFTNCSASGLVGGTKDVGGFVGKTEVPVLVNCWYDGATVSASDNTKNAHPGGFVGYAAKSGSLGGTFKACAVKGTAVDAAAGQRVGGFVGQADLGNAFYKCSVEDVTIVAGLNAGGFAGVDYANVSDAVPDGGIHCCYVSGGSITAGGDNCGGFVGYPEGAVIRNCFTTMDVDGGAKAAIGGFIGICNKNVTVQYCYEAGAVSGTGGPIGAFVGKVAGDDDTTHINACIAWNNSLSFDGQTTGGDLSGNYIGTEGTLAAKAAELGWDPAIWDFSAKLR